MPSMRAPTADSAPARRRTSRMSGDDRERVILSETERLLDQRAFHDLSVDDLATAAGISRPAFYFYFRSKEQVLLALLTRVIDEQLRDEKATARLTDDPAAAWRAVLTGSFARWTRHHGVFRAAVAARAVSPEVAQVWEALIERFVARTGHAIAAERRRGAAPPGLAPRELAVCLVRMNERVFETLADGSSPAPTESRVVEDLLSIWLSAIYGSHPYTAGPNPRERP